MVISNSFLRFLFLLSALQFYIILLSGQGVQYQQHLEETFRKATAEEKNVFIKYYDSDCPICKDLEPMFEDSLLGDFYNTHFVSYKMNVGEGLREDSLLMAQTGLNFTSVPYLLFFDKDGQFLHYSDARAEVDFLIQAGTDALNPQRRVAALEGRYKDGDRSIRTLYAYALLAKLQRNDSLQMVIADELYAVFPKSDLGTQKSYIITKNAVTSIDNGFFNYWISHLDQLKGFESGRHVGKEMERIAEILRSSIYSEERKQWDLNKIAEVKNYVLLTGLSNNPDAFFWEQETSMLIAAARYEEAMQIGDNMIHQENAGTKSRIRIIRHFLNAITKPDEVQDLKNWIDELSLLDGDIRDQADLMYLNALYFTKTNQVSEASAAITSALSFFKEHNLDTSALDELIE